LAQSYEGEIASNPEETLELAPGSGIVLPGETLTKPDGLLDPNGVDLDGMAIDIEEGFARDADGDSEKVSPDGGDRVKVRDVESSATEILPDALGIFRIGQRLFLIAVRPRGIRGDVDGSQDFDPSPFSSPKDAWRLASSREWIFLHFKRGVRWSSMSRTSISDIFVAAGQLRPICCKCCRRVLCWSNAY
jgi:hypothetical protein